MNSVNIMETSIPLNASEDFHVLVPQADSLGAVAVIRSLGSHGYKVHAASSSPQALGCYSNFANFRHQTPAYNKTVEYIAWLRTTVKHYGIVAIIPSEGFLLAIKDYFEEFSNLLGLSKNKDIVYGCLSKVYVFNQFQSINDAKLKENIPKSFSIGNSNKLNEIDLSSLKLPIFVKGDAFYSKNDDRAIVAKFDSYELAIKYAQEALKRYEIIQLQDCCVGVKATVNLLVYQGKILAESMALALHENPHTGGLMSLRKTWWNQGIYEDAVRRILSLGWEGPAMLEYKWNEAEGSFSFIELNSRYWAALNLDIRAGLHFPCIQLKYILDNITPKNRQKSGLDLIMRHAFPADFGHMISTVKDSNITTSKKIVTIIFFFLYFFHPNVKSDLNFPGDRKLVFINFKCFIKELYTACKRRLKL